MRNGVNPSLSLISLKIGKCLLTERGRLYNDDIAKRIGHDRRATHDILRSFERRGMVNSVRERGDPEMLGRTPRRFYSLTKAGSEVLIAALTSLQLSTGFVVAATAPVREFRLIASST